MCPRGKIYSSCNTLLPFGFKLPASILMVLARSSSAISGPYGFETSNSGLADSLLSLDFGNQNPIYSMSDQHISAQDTTQSSLMANLNLISAKSGRGMTRY